MDHGKEIELLANELSKAHGCIDALTAALVGVLQAMREDPSLTAEPFSQGFQRTQSYIAEILDRTDKPRLNS